MELRNIHAAYRRLQMANRLPPVFYDTYLACTLCRATAILKLPEADEKGWDWFKGNLEKRVEICPDCNATKIGRAKRMQLFNESRSQADRQTKGDAG